MTFTMAWWEFALYVALSHVIAGTVLDVRGTRRTRRKVEAVKVRRDEIAAELLNVYANVQRATEVLDEWSRDQAHLSTLEAIIRDNAHRRYRDRIRAALYAEFPVKAKLVAKGEGVKAP